MAGLQDISPMVANRCVTSAVRAPMRAAAAAASQPAWPPPTMMTSKGLVFIGFAKVTRISRNLTEMEHVRKGRAQTLALSGYPAE